MESVYIPLSSRVAVHLKGQERDLVAKQILLGVLGVTIACVGWTASALGDSVTTRSYGNARSGWNQNETVLNPANVNASTFHKIGELPVDDKIEASPLYIENVSTSSGPHDLIIVATTNATVYAFDANTNASIWSKNLGNAVQGLKPALYAKWGITATPVVDPDTNTLYVVRLAWENGNRVYRLFGLNLADSSEVVQSQAVDGFSVKRNGKFFRNGEQYIRTALALCRRERQTCRVDEHPEGWSRRHLDGIARRSDRRKRPQS